MSYQTELELEKEISELLAVISPRVFIRTWTNVSGNIWVSNFNLGYITKLTVAGVEYNLATTASNPASGEYGFDYENNLLYIYSTIDANLNLTIVATYDIYISTTFYTLPQNPTQSGGVIVDWEPVILNTPVFNQSNSDALFGYSPISSSSLQASNDNGFFNEHLYASSFNKAQIKIYHSPNRDIVSGNVSNIFNGYITSFNLNDDKISFTVSDSFAKLDDKFNLTEQFDLTEFPNLEPDAYNGSQPWYIRKIYGATPGGYRPVNIDYAGASLTTNRYWVAKLNTGATNNGTITLTIDHTAPNTSTRTYFTTTPKVLVQDWVELNHSVSGQNNVEVGAVNYASKYIDHAAISRTVSAGDTAKRYFIGFVVVIRNDNVEFTMQLNGSFFPINSLGTTGKGMGFRIASDFEGPFSFGRPFDPSIDKVACRIYGDSDDFTVDPGTSDYGGVISNAASIMYDVIEQSGIPPENIDFNSFNDLSSTAYNIGFSIPFSYDGDLPTYKEVLTKIQQSTLYSLQSNYSGDATAIGISLPKLLTANPDQIDDTQLYDFSYQHDYNDMYGAVQVNYQVPEIFNFNAENQQKNSASVVNATAVYLHGIPVTKKFLLDTCLYVTDDALDYVQKLGSITGERKGTYKIKLPRSFMKEEINNIKQILRDSLPGNSYVFRSQKTASARIIEISKTIDGVTLTLDDNRGIEENSGSW